MALDEYDQADLTAFREMVDHWRGGEDPRWNAALDHAKERSTAVSDQFDAGGCGAGAVGALGEALARYSAALMTGQRVTDDSELRGWLLLTLRGEYQQLVTVIEAILTARVVPGHPARGAWHYLNRVPELDPSGDTWDDSAVYPALHGLLNWAKRPPQTV